jgi:hypothetical protein
MKNKYFKIALLFLLLVGFAQSNNALAIEEYELLESVPGIDGAEAGSTLSFPKYMNGLYKFVLGAILIAALLMLTIGGFTYVASAGNKSLSGTAKKIITDALFGLIVAYLGWLLFHTINPDLLNIDLDFSVMEVTDESN